MDWAATDHRNRERTGELTPQLGAARRLDRGDQPLSLRLDEPSEPLPYARGAEWKHERVSTPGCAVVHRPVDHPLGTAARTFGKTGVVSAIGLRTQDGVVRLGRKAGPEDPRSRKRLEKLDISR